MKNIDTTIIRCLIVILIIIGLLGCTKLPNQTNEGLSNAGIYDGSIGTILGCVFAPANCEKYKKDTKE